MNCTRSGMLYMLRRCQQSSSACLSSPADESAGIHGGAAVLQHRCRQHFHQLRHRWPPGESGQAEMGQLVASKRPSRLCYGEGVWSPEAAALMPACLPQHPSQVGNNRSEQQHSHMNAKADAVPSLLLQVRMLRGASASRSGREKDVLKVGIVYSLVAGLTGGLAMPAASACCRHWTAVVYTNLPTVICRRSLYTIICRRSLCTIICRRSAYHPSIVHLDFAGSASRGAGASAAARHLHLRQPDHHRCIAMGTCGSVQLLRFFRKCNKVHGRLCMLLAPVHHPS